MNKVILYPRINVYQNAIPEHKRFIDLLKRSQVEKPDYFFTKWDDWYGFGDMMNLPMKEENDYSTDWDHNKIDLNNDYAKEQSVFLKTLHDVFDKVTKDYIDEYGIELPNWKRSGFSICKYKETEKENFVAMHYHTDYVGANADAPGLKFAVTCTMYLNDDYEGGGISFLEEDSGYVIDYKPKAGDVLVFPSGDPITGASHYFHGVDKIYNGEKYLVRTFWQYEYEGSKLWWDGVKEHGQEKWEIIAKEKMKEEMNSGKWHRYLVYPEDNYAKIKFSTPFMVKAKRVEGTSYFTRNNDN